MFQHVDLLLLQRLKEPLVESLTMLLWETQEERRQRVAWSRPAFLNVGGGGGGAVIWQEVTQEVSMIDELMASFCL